MKRVMTGIALAVIGLSTSAALATTANATTWDRTSYATFQGYGECNYYGQQWVAQHRISSYGCFGTFNTQPGAPQAYMNVDF